MRFNPLRGNLAVLPGLVPERWVEFQQFQSSTRQFSGSALRHTSHGGMTVSLFQSSTRQFSGSAHAQNEVFHKIPKFQSSTRQFSGSALITQKHRATV